MEVEVKVDGVKFAANLDIEVRNNLYITDSYHINNIINNNIKVFKRDIKPCNISFVAQEPIAVNGKTYNYVYIGFTDDWQCRVINKEYNNALTQSAAKQLTKRFGVKLAKKAADKQLFSRVLKERLESEKKRAISLLNEFKKSMRLVQEYINYLDKE